MAWGQKFYLKVVCAIMLTGMSIGYILIPFGDTVWSWGSVVVTSNLLDQITTYLIPHISLFGVRIEPSWEVVLFFLFQGLTWKGCYHQRQLQTWDKIPCDRMPAFLPLGRYPFKQTKYIVNGSLNSSGQYLKWTLAVPCEISDGSGVLKTVHVIFESDESVAISLGLSQWSTCDNERIQH